MRYRIVLLEIEKRGDNQGQNQNANQNFGDEGLLHPIISLLSEWECDQSVKNVSYTERGCARIGKEDHAKPHVYVRDDMPTKGLYRIVYRVATGLSTSVKNGRT